MEHIRRWEVFRTGSGIDESSAPSQIFQCASVGLGDNLLLLQSNPTAVSETMPAELLIPMRSLAVVPVAICDLRTELLQLVQSRDESFHAFTVRVRGKAETCAFNTACECGKAVNYTDHVIRDVLLNGLCDPDIRREVLGIADFLTKPINDVIALWRTKRKHVMPSHRRPYQPQSPDSHISRQVRTGKTPQLNSNNRCPCSSMCDSRHGSTIRPMVS